MSKLPTQLKWARFVAAIKALGYVELRSKGGSARHFQRDDEDPVTFHEPHGGRTLKQGTLTEYLHKLEIDREKFLTALEGGEKSAKQDEDRFRRTILPDGNTISHCCECFQEVITSNLVEEIIAAESSHICSV